MQWYYAINGQRLGPVSESEFDKLVREGTVQPTTLVWREGMAEWQAHAKVAGAAAPATLPGGAADDTEVCVVCGKRYPRREMIQYEGKWVSAEHRDEFFQRIREGLGQAGQMQYASFGRRWLAKIVDGIIFGIILGVCSAAIAYAMLGTPNYFMLDGTEAEPMRLLAFQAVVLGVRMVIGLTYDIIFLSKFQATPGKMALGLKLVRSDGSRLTVGRIVGRYYAEVLSKWFTLCIGYLIAAFDEEQRRTLHDRICDTRVIRVEPTK